SEAHAPELGRIGVGDSRLLSPHHRAFRPATMHVREQLPGGPGFVLVRRAVERVQEDRGGFHERRKSAALPSHCCRGLSPEADSVVLIASQICLFRSIERCVQSLVTPYL